MKQTQVYLLLAYTIASAVAWTVPVLLEQRTVMAYDMYYDETSGLQHVLATYLDFNTQSVFYYQIDGNNKVVYSTLLNERHVLFFTGVKITGRNNGRNLYAVLEGRYNHDNYTDIDQLFTESNNNGKSWSVLTPVPRQYMNDGCQRCGQCILCHPDTGRLFIFYRVDCRTAWAVLSYVTRPPDSKVFTQERVLNDSPSWTIENHQMVAQITLVDSLPMVHVFWVESQGSTSLLRHIWTIDNGITWSSPFTMRTHEFTFGESVATSANPALTPLLIGTYQANYRKPLQMFVTSDHGQSFSYYNATIGKRDPIFPPLAMIGMAMCGTKERPKLYMMVALDLNTYEYVVWDLKKMQSTVYDEPFHNVGNAIIGIHLACHTKNGNNTVYAVVGTSKDGRRALHLAQDTMFAT